MTYPTNNAGPAVALVDEESAMNPIDELFALRPEQLERLYAKTMWLAQGGPEDYPIEIMLLATSVTADRAHFDFSDEAQAKRERLRREALEAAKQWDQSHK